MNRSTPGLPVHHQLPEFTQTHVHRVSDVIQPSHPGSYPSTPALSPSQHQSLFQWVHSAWGGQSTRVSALVKYKFVFLVCPLIMSSFWSASYQLLLDHASFHLFTRVMMQPSSWAGESRSSDVFLWLSCICIVSISCSFLVLALSTSTYSFTAEICIKHVSILCMNLTEARWGLPWQFSG